VIYFVAWKGLLWRVQARLSSVAGAVKNPKFFLAALKRRATQRLSPKLL
jgi:hypothetical protein